MTQSQPHILCEAEDVSEYVILVGDPQRVLRVGEFLENCEEIVFNREFRTIRGKYKGAPITVTSTGIGGPSTAIAIEELIACGAKYFIRVGSGGAVQPYIKLGDLVISSGAVRDDGTTDMYIDKSYPAIPDLELTHKILETCKELSYSHYLGYVRSHDSFYIENEEDIMEYWSKKNILSSDMETTTVFVLGQLRGVKTASILNTVVEYNSNVKEGIRNYVEESIGPVEGEKREIILALETYYKIHKDEK